ncbi:Cmx/CmrA family chloramphenicol efflux MFS transporter [Actinophytocola sp.]|uniref:Cmx/CmrA family chloramphenicol efflux MFS transporter n=1 Tax=Actinophytocola sp. TaxID=1872138 RepID=UPI002ED4D0B7
MPFAVYVLGLAIFAQGTSELMLAGLLPEIAGDLGVSIPQAGLLISAFAVGMLVGAPVLAVVTLRWPRRAALLTFLAVFAATHVVGAVTSSYAVLLGTRVAGAFVYAGFWAVASVAAVGMAGPERRGRAMSVVAGGLTVATILGLPAGTAIGQHLGWRAAFWAVAIMSALTMAAVAATIRDTADATAPDLRAEVRTMANPRLWLAYAGTALTTAALIVTFSYLAPFLTDTTGVSSGVVPVLLALYGLGSLAGITIGGRTADAHPFRTLYAGAGGLVAASVTLALFADQPPPAIVAITLLGAFGFATNPALNARVFAEAGGAPTLAAATNISAFNVGITAGPWLGGTALDAGAGYPVVAWLGAALGVVALGVVTVSVRRKVAVTP